MDKKRLLFTSFVAAGKCYLSPCMEGAGMQTAFQINQGQSFQLIWTVLLLLIQQLLSIRFISKGGLSSMMHSMVVSSCVFMGVAVLQLAAEWGAYSDDLVQLSQYNGILMETQNGINVTLSTNMGAKIPFDAITAFTALLFILYFVLTVALLLWKQEVLAGGDEAVSSGYYEGIAEPEANSAYQGIGTDSGTHDPAEHVDAATHL